MNLLLAASAALSVISILFVNNQDLKIILVVMAGVLLSAALTLFRKQPSESEL